MLQKWVSLPPPSTPGVKEFLGPPLETGQQIIRAPIFLLLIAEERMGLLVEDGFCSASLGSALSAWTIPRCQQHFDPLIRDMSEREFSTTNTQVHPWEVVCPVVLSQSLSILLRNPKQLVGSGPPSTAQSPNTRLYSKRPHFSQDPQTDL